MDYGLLRGACHRARIRATRWLAMTVGYASLTHPTQSHRPFALYRHPGAGAGVRPVVPHRAVLGAAVVPERDRVLAPAKAALEQRVFRVLVEIGQHGVALIAGDADDVAGKAAVDIERL